MKKILSAVLAAAMVLSMGVLAFADVPYGEGTGVNNKPITQTSDVTFGHAYIVRDKKVVATNAAGQAYDELQAEDQLYFEVKYQTNDVDTAAPADWQIKINNAEYVEGADFYRDSKANDKLGLVDNRLYVKVTLTDFSDFEDENVNFYFYIYDKSTKERSERAYVKYSMDDYYAELTSDDLDWVITVDGPKAYKYVGSKAKKATLDFGAALVELKMYPKDSYKVSCTEKYNKDLSKEYDTEVSTIALTGIDGGDIVFPASKDNKQVVMIVDDEMVAVEAEYVKDYKFESGEKTKGYLVENAEDGVYALIDADVEIETAEEPAKDNNSTDKTNPAMGANDFVGAAVALAVVSVAAAGALALKK